MRQNSTGAVDAHAPPSPFWTIFGLLTTLTFGLLPPQSNQFIFVPNCTQNCKFGEINPSSSSSIVLMLMHGQKNGWTENIMSPAPNGGRTIKTDQLNQNHKQYQQQLQKTRRSAIADCMCETGNAHASQWRSVSLSTDFARTWVISCRNVATVLQIVDCATTLLL